MPTRREKRKGKRQRFYARTALNTTLARGAVLVASGPNSGWTVADRFDPASSVTQADLIDKTEAYSILNLPLGITRTARGHIRALGSLDDRARETRKLPGCAVRPSPRILA